MQLKHRDIDLVIKDDKDMDDFIKILVYSINTADGNSNSADAVTNKLIRTKQKEYNKKIAATCVLHLPQKWHMPMTINDDEAD